ncbi:hypothetical protein [Ilumatobacter sp.]|uniref:hypothetical protein n=1 Tax=Ilumatobacter sp. TaxID=1967498 RepID=UPI003C513FF5
MDYQRLGSTGLQVSELCFGRMSFGSSDWRPWVLDPADAEPFFTRALDAGINKPVVTAPIIGVTKMAQLDDAITSLEIELSDDDIAEMEAPYVPRRAGELGRPSLRA